MLSLTNFMLELRHLAAVVSILNDKFEFISNVEICSWLIFYTNFTYFLQLGEKYFEVWFVFLTVSVKIHHFLLYLPFG